MSKVYIPAENAEQWKQFLADPEKHWRQGFSARTLAYSWQESEGFPREVHAALSASPHFSDIDLLLAIPEHKVALPGGSRSSQNDVWVLARAHGNLVSIAVEGKVSETFGPTMQEWLVDAASDKAKRLAYLRTELGIEAEVQLPDSLRYQLLHRTASAIIEAKRFNATHAIMLVHSFSQSSPPEWFQDYVDFVRLFGGSTEIGKVVSVGTRNGVSLHFAWVCGDARYLSK
jgi:hypothetical protein